MAGPDCKSAVTLPEYGSHSSKADPARRVITGLISVRSQCVAPIIAKRYQKLTSGEFRKQHEEAAGSTLVPAVFPVILLLPVPLPAGTARGPPVRR
jgi:hypothetical protein